MNNQAYEWKPRDKWLYILSMIPFIAVFGGAAYILATYSIYLMFIFLALYIITNVFQAGCCVGCPYRGKYCPALCGVYLGNFLSVILYKNRKFEPRFFKINAACGEIMILVVALFPVYWVFRSGWYLVLIYFALIVAHFILFMATQCGKCSYNKTCPGGQFALSCRRMPKDKTG